MTQERTTVIQQAINALGLAAEGKIDQAQFRNVRDQLVQLEQKVKAHYQRLNDDERVPDGDSYNDLIAIFGTPYAEMEVKNALLVMEVDGEVTTTICSEATAKAWFDKLQGTTLSVSMMVSEHCDMETALSLHRQFRERAEALKLRIKREIELKAIMDEKGVPADVGVRQSMFRVLGELGQLPV